MIKRLTFLILSSQILLLLNVNLTLAIGVSPAILHVQDLVSGSSVEQMVKISRSETSKAEIMSIALSGEAKGHIKFPLGQTFTIGVGEKFVEFPVLIDVGQLGEGTYTALLRINSAVNPESTTDGGQDGLVGAAISTGVATSMNIIFDVTNNNIERYSINGWSMSDLEIKQKLSFSFPLINSGNVDIRPGKIDFSFTDTKDPTNTFSATVESTDIAITPAFQSQRIDIVLPYMEVTVGNYQATAIFHDKDGNIIYTGTVDSVQVYPEGTLAQLGEMNSFTSDKTHYEDGEVVQLSATFKNTGTLGTEAIFITEIYKDDKRIDIIKQDPKYIPIGQGIEFDQDYTPVVGGDYTAKAYVQYGIFKTEVMETNFSVGALSPFIIGGVLGGVCLVILLLLFWWHRRNKNKAGLTTKTPKTAKKTAGKKKK